MNWLRPRTQRFDLDYANLVFLDAETLAEAGIGPRYNLLLPELRQYVSEPAVVEEFVDNAAPSYRVRCRDVDYPIYSPPVDELLAWGRATHAFFKIVNDQLSESEYRFYAMNGGHELGGMFLTERESKAARRSLPRKLNWPYLPTLHAPWFGQFHD